MGPRPPQPRTPNMLEARCAGRRSASSHPRSCRRFLPLLAAVLQAAACGSSGGAKPDGGDGGGIDGGDASPEVMPGTPQKLLILHTNDIHSHLMGFAPELDYTPATPNDDLTQG